jgi:YHS domain-containing protein
MLKLSFVSGIVLVGFADFARAAGSEAVHWRHDFRSAAIEAINQNKPLFISIHTETCQPCRVMHRTTLQDPSVVAFINSRCVPLLVDGDKDRAHMDEWRVSAFPTHMIVCTAGAKKKDVLERIEGKVGASELMVALQRAAQKQAASIAALSPDSKTSPSKSAVATDQPKRTSERGPLQPPAPTEAEDVVKPAAFKAPADLSPMGLQSTPIALDGHCPVCMIDRAEMVKGKSSESVVHNGRKFQFASAENKKRFLQSPTKYLPGANGDCVVSMVDGGKRVAGDTRFPAMFADKVYFLADKQSRDKFLKDPEAYVDAKGEPRPTKSK